MCSQSEGAPEIQESRSQDESRRRSEGMDPFSIPVEEIERLQRLADESQRTRGRLCRLVRPCGNSLMWAAVGTLSVSIAGMVVYGLVLVLEGIL